VPSLGPIRSSGPHAILVDRGAWRIHIGGAHDKESAAVGCDRRVGALIEHNRVVFDVTSVAEPKLTDAAAVACAQVPANPVVVEFIVVRAGAEADTACPRRRGREQFVAGGRVRRDRVVVHVHVQVMAVRQLSTRGYQNLSRLGKLFAGRSLEPRLLLHPGSTGKEIHPGRR